MIMKGFFHYEDKKNRCHASCGCYGCRFSCRLQQNPIGDTQIGDSENKPGDTKTPSAEGGLTLEEISKQIEAKVGKQDVDSKVVMTLDGS